MSRRTRRAVALLGWVALVGALLVPQLRAAERAADLECPAGYEPTATAERPVAPDVASRWQPEFAGGIELDYPDALQKGTCIARNRPEAFQELAVREAQFAASRYAPFDSVAPGADSAAAAERQQMLAQPADVEGADGTFRQYGTGPLIFDDPRYDEVNKQGLVDSTGRIDEFEYEASTGRLFAAIGTGGVWLSEDLGESFVPISDSLPTQVVGSVAYSPPTEDDPDGVVHVITGEHTFGGSAYPGIGAYYSTDLGETWVKSEGVPDAALGFAIEIDQANPDRVYAATGNGLWRSDDAGRTYDDVVLPTGDCAGDYNDRTCNFANFVTDVVVKAPGGVGDDIDGGDVIAAVGWRAGTKENPDGSVQSPANGIYRSETGEPGTFEVLDGLADAVGGQERLGRVEMGEAYGDEQDHDYLYAVVQDAVRFNSGGQFDFLPGGDPVGLGEPTVLNGIYVSDDFGASWTVMGDRETISRACLANRSVYCIPGLIEPGAQSWYNQWISPDPSTQVGGVPTRLTFGLEEVWANRTDGIPTPQNGPTSFEVIGAYYAAGTCLLVATDCAGAEVTGITTPHPDQHAGIFVETPESGTALMIGHDGGFSKQFAAGADGYDQDSWILDQENGLQTLLPYSAVIANDGVAYAGLQDNGHMRVSPEDGFRQFETIGADGTFAAVDPENSDYAFESIQNGRMNVTTDGGQTYRDVEPPADNKKFVNPFVMDPLNSNHITTGGRQINETLAGPDVANGEEGNEWLTVFDLGTTIPIETETATDVPTQADNGMSAIDTIGDATYVGFCGVCDILNQQVPFRNGIATNVGGAEPPVAGTSDGWHFATADGLPNRYITSVAIAPSDPNTIYVTLGGYSRKWVPPGSVNDMNDEVGEGHVFKSTDAGETFVDISGNLPDLPTTWVEPRGDQLIIGTDNGVYISSDDRGTEYAVLGGGQLPAVPITSLQLKPDDRDTLLVGTYGRSLWLYEFPPSEPGEVRRVAGADRVQTSIATSRELFGDGSADAAVLARADDYADALAGAPFARSVNAPVLLTPSNALGTGVLDEVRRLGAETVHVLGGVEAIEPAVEAELEAAGVTVERVGGGNRFDTARLLASELGGTEVYVAEGFDDDPARGWPDALAVAPLAAAQGRPILLVDTNGLPGETAEAIESLGVEAATVVGGTSAVSQATEDAVADLGVGTDRVGGATRFETSAQVAGLAEQAGLSFAQTWLARGGNWPDALSSGPTVAASGGILLLVGDTSLEESPPTRDLLQARACEIEVLRLLGGIEAIAALVETQVTELLAACVVESAGGEPISGTPRANPGRFAEQPPAEPVVGPFSFDEGTDEFTASRGLLGTPTTSWARTSDGGVEGTGGFQVAPYDDSSDTSLISPELDVPAGEHELTFSTRYDVEGGGFDETVVEVSVGDGDFEQIGLLGGQNVGFPEFSTVRLPFNSTGDPVTVRLTFTADEICASTPTPPGVCARPDGYEGTFIDDVAIRPVE